MSNMPKSDFFTIGPVTLSYVDNLFTPGKASQADADAAERYSVNIIFNEQQKQQIQQWVDYIGNWAFPQDYNIPNRVKVPIRSVAEKPAYAERFPGHYFASVKSQFKPVVVDQWQQPVPANNPDPNRTDGQKILYGGVQAYVSINVWSTRHPKGGPVVSLGINAVQKTGDAEPLVEGGSVDIAAVFANVPKPTVGAPAPQPGGFPQGGPPGAPMGAPQGAPPAPPGQAPGGPMGHPAPAQGGGMAPPPAPVGGPPQYQQPQPPAGGPPQPPQY